MAINGATTAATRNAFSNAAVMAFSSQTKSARTATSKVETDAAKTVCLMRRVATGWSTWPPVSNVTVNLFAIGTAG